MSLLKIEYQTNKDAIKTKMHQGKTIRKDILDLRLKQTTKVTPTLVILLWCEKISRFGKF